MVIPADATPGTHTLASVGTDPQGRPRELTATITVLEGRAAALPASIASGSSAGASPFEPEWA